MHLNEELIRRFYTSFANRAADSMAQCYTSDAEFSDEVFQGLKGTEVTAMWRMLCERGKDLVITFDGIHADDRTGSADWEARYSFSKTGRIVHNKNHATFEFRDGLIARHTDSFDLWRWARMALGPKGLLLGWLPPVQSAIRREARGALDGYMRRE